MEGYFLVVGEDKLGVAVERFRRVEDGLEAVGEELKRRDLGSGEKLRRVDGG